jgi:signal transduction histidine kinase
VEQHTARGEFHCLVATFGTETQASAERLNAMGSATKESYKDLEKRVADRTKALATLNAIAETASQSLELETMLTATLDKVLELLGFESGAIYLKDLETDALDMVCYRGLSDAFRQVAAKGIISAKTAKSCKSIIIDDLPQEPDAPKEVVREGYRSLASIPLLCRGQVQGVLTTSSRKLRCLSQPDVDLLLSIGQQIGVAIENARLFEIEQRRAEQFRAISEVGRHITSILDVDVLMEEIVCLVGKTFGYYLVGIGLVEGDEVVVKTGAGPYWGERRREPLRLKVGDEGIVGWVGSTGEPLLVPDVSQEPRYYQVSDIIETRSELAVPLRTKNDIIGVLDVQSKDLDAFDESDVVVLQSVANQAAVAIENARLYETEQRRAEQFRVISKVGSHITSILDVDDLLEEIVHLVRKAFGYYLVGIGLNEGDLMVTKTGDGPAWDDPAFEPPRLKVGEEGIMGWVAGTGEPVLAPDVSQEPRYILTPQTAGTRSELCVPLKTKNGVIGVLDLQSEELNAFDESDLVVLQSLAHQAAIAIENARLYEQAQQLATLEERQRLARELHDSVTQSLYSVTLFAEAARRLASGDDGEQMESYLDQLGETAQQALKEMRLLVYELRPSALEQVGLVEALRQRLEAVEGRAGVEAQFLVDGTVELPEAVEEGLYLIAHEALNNVLKHAQVTSVTVRICADGDHVELEVEDNGKGFDPGAVSDRGGMGLINMRERAERLGGSLTLVSAPREGTRVKVVVSQ